MIELGFRLLLLVLGLGHLLAVVWFSQYLSVLLAIPAITVLILACSTEKIRRRVELALLCILSIGIVAWGLFVTPWTDEYAPRVIALVIEGILFLAMLLRELQERVRYWL